MTTPHVDASLAAYAEDLSAITERVLEADPTLPVITAHIIAGDLMSAQRATQAVQQGMPVERAVYMVGSYARWEWAIQMVAQGALTEQWFQDNITELWSSSDPDDTKPEYLAIWRKARAASGGVIRDGRPLPKGGVDHLIRVYRGGPPGNTLRTGFAWTTDPKIARLFANGAGVRRPMTNGVVISGLVKSTHVLAYITGRNESEVIVDPRNVSHIKTGEPK